MKISGKEAQDLVAEVTEVYPEFAEHPAEKIRQLVGMVLMETTNTNRSIEERVADAGGIPPDITLTLMHYGALLAIVMDLPPDNPRRLLIEAGQRVGAFIAKKFGEKISEQIAEKTTKH